MPSAHVAATAEGMTEIHIENRIAELSAEISQLMDKGGKPFALIVFQASTRMKPKYENRMLVGKSSFSSVIIDGVDELDHARSFVDLVNFALDSLSGDDGMRTEIKALQEGMSAVGKHLEAARASIEDARAMAELH